MTWIVQQNRDEQGIWKHRVYELLTDANGKAYKGAEIAAFDTQKEAQAHCLSMSFAMWAAYYQK